jgi:hypothetical protein
MDGITTYPHERPSERRDSAMAKIKKLKASEIVSEIFFPNRAISLHVAAFIATVLDVLFSSRIISRERTWSLLDRGFVVPQQNTNSGAH